MQKTEGIMKDIVIIGAGNLGREVTWIIEDINRYKPTYTIRGFLDDINDIGTRIIKDYCVIGNINDLEKISKNNQLCAVVAVSDAEGKKSIIDKFPDFDKWERIIHPDAHIADTSIIGKGTIICDRVSISVNCTIGEHCLLNISSIIGHDCVIADYVSIMSSVCVSGHVKISEMAYLGANSTVLPHVCVGEHSCIGAGSVVIRKVKPNITVMGVPAKMVRF